MKTELKSIIGPSRLIRCAGRSILRLLGFWGLGLAVSSVPAATITWTGATSSYWTNSANWSPAQVPAGSDTVIINSGTVTLTTNSQFAVLNINAGTISGPGVVAPGSVLNWAAGRFGANSSLVVQSNGLMNLLSSGEKDVGGAITNYGHVVWSGGQIYVMNDNSSYAGAVVNLGLWEMQGDVNLGQWWNNDYAGFGNGGIFRKSTGTGTGVISLPFLNGFGAVEVRSGTLRFDHGQQLDGLFNAEAGTVLQLNGGTFTYTPPGRFTGDGQYRLTGGTLQGLDDYMPNWRFSGGTLYLSANYQTDGTIGRLDLEGATLAGTNQVSGVLNLNSGYISGAMTINPGGVMNWSAGRLAQASSLLVASNGLVNFLGTTEKYVGGRMTNFGTVAWNGGTLYLLNDGGDWTGNIQNFGLWDARADLPLSRYYGNDYAFFQNNGVLRKSAGTGISTIDVSFLNQATLESLSGTLSFTHGLSSTAGSMRFGLSNSNSFGQIKVTGTASLNGSLGARLVNGYIPDAGRTFQVLSAGSLSGSFTNIDGLAVGFGRVLSPIYSATNLVLQTAVTNGVNNPPVWGPVPNFSLIEGQSLLYTNQVIDPDGDQIVFKLVSGPSGAALDLTNGVLSWMPTEAQGGSSNAFTVRILDSGNPSLGATQSFYVLVGKTNSAPVLPSIGGQLVGVGGVLTVTNTAVDGDLPANVLTYSLVSAPAGMSVDTNGIIAWAPSNAGNYQVTMRVLDNGTPALSATNSFTVGVLTQAVPPAGLVSWWTGDGTTADKNGVNDGVLSGVASYGAGLFGQAFSFNGGYLTVLDSPSLSFAPGSALTVEMWVKRSQAGSVPYYFGKRVACGSYNYQSPSDQFSAGTAYDSPAGQWQHYAWVFTGTEMLGYANGALVYRSESTLGAVNTAALFIGASGTCGQTFVGLIEDVRIYNRALSAEEVQGVYGAQSLSAPVLTQQPASQMALSGSTVVLSASATGSSPLSYQWWYNGAPLGGQTLPTLTLSGVTVAQSGSYSVAVSNALGLVTSDAAGLTVVDAPSILLQPQSQLGVVGGSVTFTVVATGTPTPVLSYQWRKGGLPLSGQTGTALTLNNLQLSDAGSYDVQVGNWAGNALSQAATLLVSTPIVWTGAISSDWNNRTNWNPQQVPTSLDTVAISSGTVQASNSQFYALSFSGGTLNGSVAVASNCVMYWSGGRLGPGSSLTVLSHGLVTLTGSAQKELGGRMTNWGQVVWSAGTLSILNNNSTYLGGVTNLGEWEMQGDLTLGNYYGNYYARFGNNGTWHKSAGTGTGIIGVPFCNGPEGTVSVESGTLRFDYGLGMDGTFTAEAGTVMVFNGGTNTYVPGSQFTGAGQYQMKGGTLQGLEDYVPNLQLQGGTVYLSPNYQGSGAIARLDLAGATLGGSSNRVVGLLNVVNGNISGALEVASDAVVNLNGTYVYGATLVRSGATLNWLAGRFAVGSSLLVQSQGLVNLLGGGEKDVAGPMTNYGHVVWSGGQIYVMNDNSSYAGAVVNLGLWEMQGDVNLGQWWNNDYASFGNGGIFRKSAGTGSGTINLPFLNSFGAVEVWSGTLRFDHGQQLDGLFSTETGTAVQCNGGTFTYTPPGQFTGQGQYRLTGGTLQGLDDFMPNWQLAGGTVSLSADYQTNGTIGRLDLEGATLAGTNQVSGVLNLNGGYVSGVMTINPGGVMNWSAGRLAGGASLLVASNGLVNILGTTEKDVGGKMTNFGTVVWSGGTLYFMNDNTTYFGAAVNAGAWEMQGDLTMGQWWNNDYATYANSGRFHKTAGTGTAVVSLPFSNASGTTDASSGTLSFTHGLSSTAGSMMFGLSNSNSFGQIKVTGTASLNGSLGARLLNGYIPDAGRTFQVLSAGSLSGSFTNTDGLAVGFGRALSPIYSATNLVLQTAVTNGVNNPPVWGPVPNFSLIEGQSLLYTNQVIDPDGDQIVFKLVSGPSGAALDLTNGVLSWTPTEAQGGSSNAFTVRILDSGNPSLGATQSFYVLVGKTNSAPVLPSIGGQLVGVGGVLTVTNTAVDGDLPANVLTYSLVSAPAGMSVDTNGIIAWAPSNAGNYQVTMRVLDNGTPALSATNSFTVGVLTQAVPPAGLVSWWTGDGTTADKNGVNDGVLSGVASYGAGLFGQAFNFNGGYLAVPDSPSLSFAPGSALTVEMWVKRSQAGSLPYYFGKRVACSSYNYESPSDVVAGAYWNAPVGQWQHYAWVFTGTEMLGYVNGAPIYWTESTLGPVNALPLLIGASGTCGQTFVGLIEDVRIYNRALSAEEVQGVYGAQSLSAPVLTQQPASQMALSGSTVVLSASATGSSPLSYQWWYNGAPLGGQTLPTLTLSGVTVAQSGSYSVAVSNALGLVTSDAAGLTVVDAPSILLQPQSQLGVVGGSVTFTVVATGTPTPVLSYQWRKGGLPLSGQTGTALTLNNLQLSDAGSYDVQVGNWAGNALSQAATLLVSTPIVWTGAISSDWNNRTNWNPQQVPTSLDTVAISSGTVQASNSQFYALSFSGGTLNGSVAVASNCVMYWSGGRLGPGSSLTVLSHGLVTLTGSAQKELGGRMTNWGQVVWSAGTLSILNNNSTYLGGVTNLGEWEMQGDLTLGNYYGNYYARFGNNGTWHKSAGTGTGIIGVPFCNGPEGTVSVESGTLRFDYGLGMDGTFTAEAGTVMVFNGGTNTYVTTSQFTGEGQYQMKGGTLQGLEDYVPNLQLQGGTVYLSPNYQGSGAIARLDLAGATLGGSSNRVVGLLNVVNGNISGALEVASDAVVNLNGTYVYGATLVRSGAALNWLAGRFAVGSSLLVQSQGLVNLLGGGEKDVAGPMTNYGHVVWSGGQIYVMNDNSSYAGAVVNLGLWEMQGDVNLGQWWNNDYASFGNGGIFRKSAGTGSGTINLPFLNSFGAVEVWSGTLRFDHGQQLDGLFSTETGTAVQCNGGTFTYTPPGQFTGQGQYRLTGGTLQGLDDFMPNWQLAGGTVSLSADYQTNGTIGRLDLDGATLAGTNQVSGVLNLNSGYVSGSLTVNPGGVMNWSAGRLAAGASLLVASNGLVNMLGTTEKDVGGKMTNFGTVVWSGGTLYFMNDNTTYFGAAVNAGVWAMQGDLTMGQWWNNDYATYANSGLFHKTAGTGTGVVSLPFSNASGTTDATTGTLRFDHGASLDGIFVAETGAVIQFNSGTFSYTPQTHLTGAGFCRLTGGTLQDLDDYLPNLQLVGGNVSLSPTYQTNGTIGRLDLNGSTLLGSNRVSGVMNLASGHIDGPMTVSANAVLNWSSGRFVEGSSLLIESNGLANLLTIGVKDLGGPLVNAGQVEWTAGSLTLWNDAITWHGAIVNSGLWEMQGDLSMSQYWANNNASFQNTGTLRKPVGSGTATMDVVFYNQGVIEHLSGGWTFGRNFSLTEGTVLFGFAGDSNFGRITLSGTASLAGRLAVRLLNGYVPATNRTFQIMSYGVVAGTFTDYTGLDVGSGRAFKPVYSSNSLTLVTYETNSNLTPIVLSNPTADSSRFSFFFTANPGANYTVQYSTNVGPASWNVLLITNIPVSPAKVTDTNPPVTTRFYRVISGP